MKYYCKLDSSGSITDTNLQLYSLIKASDEWNELISVVKEDGVENVNMMTERLSFIVLCFGLSLAQLMGQNIPYPQNDEIEQPDKLLSNLMNRSKTDRITKNRLNSIFREFLVYYGAIRHFGKTKDDKKYLSVDKLTLSELNRFRKMTIEIWDLIIEMYRKDKENDLEEIHSITEIVHFIEI
jgi:hypothetical protein